MQRTSSAAAAVVHRVPVLSAIEGLGDAVRAKLRAGSSPAAGLFREGRLEIHDLPAPTLVHATAAQQQLLADAEILLGDAAICAPLLLRESRSSASATPAKDDEVPVPTRLRWVQATFAGVEAFQRLLQQQKREPPSFALTRAGGVMPLAMAQYVFGWIIAVERKFFEAQALQRQAQWDPTAIEYRPFTDLTVGVLGLGDIGQAIGRTLKHAGFQVVGFKRQVNALAAPDAFDCAHRVTNNLAHVLDQADVLVSVLPSTAATRGLLHEGNLALCARRKPLLINVGRGDLISEAALLQALDKKWLSRAVLDVFTVEPLPKASPLWGHPRVHITPHVAAKSFPSDVAEVFIANLNAYLAKEPLRYQVNWSTGY